jgi:hypothetical protein
VAATQKARDSPAAARQAARPACRRRAGARRAGCRPPAAANRWRRWWWRRSGSAAAAGALRWRARTDLGQGGGELGELWALGRQGGPVPPQLLTAASRGASHSNPCLQSRPKPVQATPSSAKPGGVPNRKQGSAPRGARGPPPQASRRPPAGGARASPSPPACLATPHPPPLCSAMTCSLSAWSRSSSGRSSSTNARSKRDIMAGDRRTFSCGWEGAGGGAAAGARGARACRGLRVAGRVLEGPRKGPWTRARGMGQRACEAAGRSQPHKSAKPPGPCRAPLRAHDAAAAAARPPGPSLACSVLPRSKWPPTGLAAATMEVRAGRDATSPAFATLTSCCSIASRRALGGGEGDGGAAALKAGWTPLRPHHRALRGRRLPTATACAIGPPGRRCRKGHPLAQTPTWCSPPILSNSSTQHTPLSPSTTAPASNMESPVTGSRTTDTVRPAPVGGQQQGQGRARRVGMQEGAGGRATRGRQRSGAGCPSRRSSPGVTGGGVTGQPPTARASRAWSHAAPAP